MNVLSTSRNYILLTLIVGLLFMGGAFYASLALTPMKNKELRDVTGQEGANVTFKLLFNNGDLEGANGTIFLGGGSGNGILFTPGNEGHLAMGDISSNFTWDTLRVDAASINGTEVINIKMNDADDVSGVIHVDQIGVTKSNTLDSTNVPANLMGDVTLNGTFNFDGSIQAFPN